MIWQGGATGQSRSTAWDLPKLLASPLGIMLGLYCFHLCLSVVMFLLAQSSILADFHNGQGFWYFAGDSTNYHRTAAAMAERISQGDLAPLWNSGDVQHIKWIAISYLIFGTSPLALAPLNALLWVCTVYLAYQIALMILSGDKRTAVIAAALVGFWPSHLAHSFHLLREPFYNLGVLLMVFCWLKLLAGQKVLAGQLLLALGLFLALQMRSYLAPFWLVAGALAFVLCLIFSRRIWPWATMALCITLLVASYYQYRVISSAMMNGGSSLESDQGVSSRVGQSVFNTVQRSRLDFNLGGQPGDSTLDTGVQFSSATDLITYLPRALEVGFLAPFPEQWIEKGSHTGRIGRLASGLEMIALYLIYLGFIVYLITGGAAKGIKIWSILLLLGILVPLAMTVSNIGALHRMRFIYLVPIIIAGFGAWHRLWARRRQVRPDA